MIPEGWLSFREWQCTRIAPSHRPLVRARWMGRDLHAATLAMGTQLLPALRNLSVAFGRCATAVGQLADQLRWANR